MYGRPAENDIERRERRKPEAQKHQKETSNPVAYGFHLKDRSNTAME